MNQAKTLPELYKLWDELGDILVDSSDNTDKPFLHFPKGTFREVIWHWFESQNSEFVCGEVMSGVRKANQETEMEIVITKIGEVVFDDGRDEYVLLSRKDDDLTPKQAEEWLLKRVYRQWSGAGSYFCDTVRAVQAQYSTTDVICTVQHRYDI